MSDLAIRRDAWLGEDTARPLQSGVPLDTLVIIRELSAHDPGFHADWATRQNVWHPRQDELQGLFYYHKHVSSMDRGMAYQWPEWTITEDLVQVPLDYALLHDDMPVLDLLPGETPELLEGSMAAILKPQLDDVKTVGWAEVMYHLCRGGYVTPGWCARTFNVPMDWYGTLRTSPLLHSLERASEKGFA